MPAQSDYLQATKGGGHGDYRTLVLAPWSVQEAADLTRDAFDLADHYRNPVIILGDGLIGQMMEPCELGVARPPLYPLAPKTWATTGNVAGRPRAVINSLFLDPNVLERHVQKLAAKYEAMARDEVRVAHYGEREDLDVLLVAYGSVARVCLTALETLLAAGLKVGLLRPISLFPFPYRELRAAAEHAAKVLVVEMSCGQMLEDVELAVAETRPVGFYGRQGGNLVSPEEVVAEAKALHTSARVVTLQKPKRSTHAN